MCGFLWEGRGDVDAEGLERMDVQPFRQVEKTLSRRSVPAFFNPSRPSWCPKNLFLVWPTASVGTTIHTGTQESREAIPADDDQSDTKVKPNSHSQVKKLVEAVGPADVSVRSTVRRMQTEQEVLLSPAGLAVRLIMEGRHVETRRRSGHPCLAGLLSVATWR